MKNILLGLLLALSVSVHAYEPCSRVVYSYIPGNVTSPSSVQGTSMVYLTGSASAMKVFISNPLASTVTAKYFFTNVSYAAAGATVTAVSLQPGSTRWFEGYGFKYLHVYSPTPNGTTATAGVAVEVCY